MPTHSREKSVRTARNKISDARLIAFLRSASSSGVLAVQLAREQLDDGETLDGLFYTGEQDGYDLMIRLLSGDKIKIDFSCIAGPLAGDGGEWTVVIELDAVKSISGGRNFIT